MKLLKQTLVIALLLAASIWGALTYMHKQQVPQKLPNIFVMSPAEPTTIEYEGLKLEAMPGSVDAPLEIVINKVSDRNETGNLTDEYDLQPEGITFNKWVKLSMPYNPNALTAKTPNITLEYRLSNGHVIKLPFTIDRAATRLITWIREL